MTSRIGLTLLLSLLLDTTAEAAAGTTKEATAMTTEALTSSLNRRFAGDRTKACIAAAVIDGAGPTAAGTVSQAFVCADPAQRRNIDGRTAFEIGSVSKTMTGVLLGQLAAEGRVSLEDPLARYLPKGTRVPSFEGQGIRLKHLVTHTSGVPPLPSRMLADNLDNPYAAVNERVLLDSLADVTLREAPGRPWAYSNYGGMLLSYALTRAAGQDLDKLLAERVFRPLGMKQAFIGQPPAGVVVAKGHLPGGKVTSAWDFPTNLAGVGGVRASLDDMVRYARAALGWGDKRTGGALARSQQPVDLGPATARGQAQGPQMGLGWLIAPVAGRRIVCHEGGTGGFSASVAFEPENRRAVVLLSDTALHTVGNLESVALHLLGVLPTVPPPRKLVAPPAELLTALAGRYRLEAGLGMKLSTRGGKLYLQTDGQEEYELGHDSEGDFFPFAFDALLSPVRSRAGMAFTWTRLGTTSTAKREAGAKGGAGPGKAAGKEPVANAEDYRGEYPLLPGFGLTVTADKGKLFVQGTGQSLIEVEPVAKDIFVAEIVGAELTFERDGKGRVQAVTLKQAGQRMRGTRKSPDAAGAAR